MGEELSTDYEGRCGNCHSMMRPNDKYCRYCGTPKGKGKFLPYRNEMYCVYGPPIKEVFKCPACGHRWAVAGLGGDDSKYCPQCCSQQLNVERREIRDFGEFIGTDLSEDLPEGYQFLSEEEVVKLLDLRSNQEEDSEEVAKRIKQHGFTDLDKAEAYEEELTEKEAERANLQRTILTDTTGNNLDAMHMTCPVCKGKMIAGIRYKTFDDKSEDDGYADLGYPDTEGNGVYCDAMFYWRDRDDDPKYQCLQCGNKFV